MSRAPDQFAPSRLSRQQRRRLDRALRKLFRHNVCSFCGSSFKHNSHTAGGLDAQGNVVLTGECCISRVAKIFAWGFYSNRKYDFLLPTNTEPSTNTEPTGEQIADAIAAYQKAIAATDKVLDGVERRGGVAGRLPQANLLDYTWKRADRDWFERNQDRSHRVRAPFPGECDAETANIPAGHALIMLVRQVEPGSRIRAAVCCSVDLLPLSDDEAAAHALFEVAMQCEAVPPDREALCSLIKKYTVRGSRSDA
jgi:hypothetical protein